MASVLLAAAMILTAVPVGASGFTAEEVEEDGFQWGPLEEYDDTFALENSESTNLMQDADSFVEMILGGETKAYNDQQIFFNDFQQARGDIQIKLLSDIEIQGYIPVAVGQEVTFDLNGHELKTGLQNEGRHFYAIDNYGVLTLLDSSSEQTGKIYARGIENLSGGTMIIESGKIVSCDSNGGACVWNEGDLTIHGGTFQTKYVGTPNDSVGIGCLNNQGKALITGGIFEDFNKRTYAIISTGEIEITPGKGKEVTVHGAHGGLAIDAGTAVVNGGMYSSDDYYGLYVSNDGFGADPMKAAVTVNGGSFDGKQYSVWIGSDYNNPVNSTIIINGGEFKQPLNAQEVTRENAIIVTGGTFAEEDSNNYVADGYELVEVSSGKYEVQPLTENNANANIKVGNRYYKTLNAAINAAPSGETIVLLKDLEEDVIIEAGKSVILDINGHTLTNEKENTIKNSGNLTIIDSKGNGIVDNISHARAAIWNEPGGQVILQGGTYTRSHENGNSSTNNGGNSYYTILNHGDMIINDGVNVTQDGHYSSLVENGWYDGTTPGAGKTTLVINGGSFGGGINTIKNDDWGELTIHGGTFKNTTQHAVMNWNEATINGGSFESTENSAIWNGYGDASMDQGNLVVNGGTFKSAEGKVDIYYYNGKNGGSVTVSGGTFSSEVPEEFCAPGFEPVKNADGSYGVEKPAPVIPVYYYNVTFDSQGGSSVSPIYSVREYTTIKAPVAPTKEGYDFAGWYKDAEGTTPWDFEKDWVTRNITLYAKWTEKEPEIPPVTAPAPVVVKLEEKTTNEVSISWTASEGALGYTLWTRAEGEDTYTRRYICYGDEGRSYTWKNRKPGTKYYFVVKAWTKDENGAYLFSEASRTVRGTTKPLPAEIEKVTVNANGDMKVTLRGKAVGANRYAMCWSRTADFGRYRIGIRTQYTKRTIDKNLKPGTYYVKVRSYRQLSTSRVYGDWSEAVKVVIS